MVSNFYHGDDKVIFQMRRGKGICHPIFYDLVIFQVPLVVQSLEKLEILPIFGLCPDLWLISTD